jgi:hypothetical protein
MIGNIDTDRNLYQFRKQVLTIINKQKIDLVIGNNVPGNILKLMYFINLNSGIPYISDLRDLDNLLLLKKQPKFTFKQKVYLSIKYYWIKKWLSNSFQIIVASEGIGVIINKMKLKYKLIYNGYNDFVDSVSNRKIKSKNKLLIGVLGTINRKQNFNPFIEGVNRYLKKHNNHIKIVFIGGEEIKEEIKEIIKRIPSNVIELTPWFDYRKSIVELNNCDLFLYFGWDGYHGIYSAKIFNYLGLRKPILLCPGDKDVLDKLIIKTRSGNVINDPISFEKLLFSFQKEKQNKGHISYFGNGVEIDKYKRSTQANKLIKIVNALTN